MSEHLIDIACLKLPGSRVARRPPPSPNPRLCHIFYRKQRASIKNQILSPTNVCVTVWRISADMAEPIASSSTAADAADEENQPVANNAEDRKAAAALNNLNTQEISQDGEGTTKQRSAADQEALSKAISQLEIASGGAKKTEASKKVEAKKKEEAEVKKKIKVSQEDITFLVNELDISKVKATELLRSYEGDATKAIKAFIAPQVKV
jgi:NACalpha-BTF3-like transcription factor